VAKYEPSLKDSVQDIITFDYEATNVSQDSIRFNIRAPGPRSLMDSEVIIRIPIKIYPKRCYRFVERQNRYLGSFDGFGFGELAAAGDRITAAEWKASFRANSPGAGRNLGTCERAAAIWKSLQSAVVEVNGTSISHDTDSFIHLTDCFLMTEEDERQGLQPMDSGSAGNFLGRAYTFDPARVADAGTAASLVSADSAQRMPIRFPQHEADVGMAKRVAYFKKHALHSNDATDVVADGRWDAALHDAHGTEPAASGPYKYVLVGKIPLAPFTRYQNGMASRRRSMVPYITSLSLQLNFKPNPTRFFTILQSTAVQSNASTCRGTLHPVQEAEVAGVIGGFTLANALTQIPDRTSTITIADDTPRLTVRWVNPKQSHQIAPSYVMSCPRWVTYKKQTASVNLQPHLGGYMFRWNQLKLSSLPQMMIISCRPRCENIADHVDYEAFRTAYCDTSYADTFDCMPDSGESAVALRVSINEKSSLVSTYTTRDLFNILLKAIPGYRYSYETWLREKQLIVLTPDCFPSDKPAGVFWPVTVSIECPFVLSVRHLKLRRQLAVSALLAAGQSNALPAQPYDAPIAHLKSEASLSLFYEDSLALSSNAAAVQQFMVNESVLSQKPVSQTAPAMDGLQM